MLIFHLVKTFLCSKGTRSKLFPTYPTYYILILYMFLRRIYKKLSQCQNLNMIMEQGSAMSIMKHRIPYANEKTHLHGIHTTYITNKFLREKNQFNNQITAKHQKLSNEICHLDDAAIILDKNDK